jgi:hypothetical protein
MLYFKGIFGINNKSGRGKIIDSTYFRRWIWQRRIRRRAYGKNHLSVQRKGKEMWDFTDHVLMWNTP